MARSSGVPTIRGFLITRLLASTLRYGHSRLCSGLFTRLGRLFAALTPSPSPAAVGTRGSEPLSADGLPASDSALPAEPADRWLICHGLFGLYDPEAFVGIQHK